MIVWVLFVFMLGRVCEATGDEERVDILEFIVKQQEQEGDALRARLRDLERRISDLKEARANRRQENSKPKPVRDADNIIDRTSTMTGGVSKRQVYPYQQAAFHAYMNGTRCYHLDSALAFDMKTVDVGGGFSHDNIIYDIPYAGTYVFTWTVTAWPISGKIVTELYLNNNQVGVLTSDPDTGPLTGNGIHPATGVVVVKVGASDHVSVRMKDAPPSTCGGDVLSSDSMVRSTFSGWRLSEISQ